MRSDQHNPLEVGPAVGGLAGLREGSSSSISSSSSSSSSGSSS